MQKQYKPWSLPILLAILHTIVQKQHHHNQKWGEGGRGIQKADQINNKTFAFEKAVMSSKKFKLMIKTSSLPALDKIIH